MTGGWAGGEVFVDVLLCALRGGSVVVVLQSAKPVGVEALWTNRPNAAGEGRLYW